ncbi:hypothetical protein CUMW_094390 [Citrus unshiu]|uniref:Transmembrane protein n=1 Tax=Citrus unshiu TaxID=55188 RepID=A0A2H5P1F8_CITUN|nr:hypothetical protein CUMW_094390 [Citrus unshiu]
MTIICNAKSAVDTYPAYTDKGNIQFCKPHAYSTALLFIIMMLIVVCYPTWLVSHLEEMPGKRVMDASNYYEVSTRIAAEITLIQRQLEHFWIPKPWEDDTVLTDLSVNAASTFSNSFVSILTSSQAILLGRMSLEANTNPLSFDGIPAPEIKDSKDPNAAKVTASTSFNALTCSSLIREEHLFPMPCQFAKALWTSCFTAFLEAMHFLTSVASSISSPPLLRRTD